MCKFQAFSFIILEVMTKQLNRFCQNHVCSTFYRFFQSLFLFFGYNYIRIENFEKQGNYAKRI